MKKTGAWLVRYALEQIGVKYTFGIPGVHNTEIYDEINKSSQLRPILVTHEGGGAFMADAVSRTGDQIGCLLVVPAAGLTHAASGVAEASLDGVPMLIISGGIRTDGMQYQLHDMDQHALMAPITKATFKVNHQSDIISTIYKAYNIAMTPEQGPVYVEIPVNISLFQAEVPSPIPYRAMSNTLPVPTDRVTEAAKLLAQAKNPGLFLGWGAVDAEPIARQIAEWLSAPVATTLQGLSAFSAAHPLHTGMGLGTSAVPAVQVAFKHCDCMLAVGTRFSEIATGSFGCKVPSNLIHIDVNPDVFSANYPAKVAIEGDASAVLTELFKALQIEQPEARKNHQLAKMIADEKRDYLQAWKIHNSKNRVNPGHFFSALNARLNEDSIVVTDDGNHTFLTAELLPIYKPRHFISPTDFNCMGYCVPAAIGAKLVHPDKLVAAIVGDGAFMMTCMELATAARERIAPIIFVFNDGELAQISQAQQLPYNRKTCTQLGDVNIGGVAAAVGCITTHIANTNELDAKLDEAFGFLSQGYPVVVDVNIDYSKSTQFTKGIVSTNLRRFSFGEKTRFVSRAVKRKITG